MKNLTKRESDVLVAWDTSTKRMEFTPTLGNIAHELRGTEFFEELTGSNFPINHPLYFRNEGLRAVLSSLISKGYGYIDNFSGADRYVLEDKYQLPYSEYQGVLI